MRKILYFHLIETLLEKFSARNMSACITSDESSLWNETTNENHKPSADSKNSNIKLDSKQKNKDGQKIWDEKQISTDLRKLPEADTIFDLVQTELSQKTQNCNKNTGLLISAWMGNAQSLRTFLENGASVETCDSCGRTPLHIASCSGAAECVEILLKFEASVKTLDRFCEVSPLHCAASYGHVDCLKLLMEYGADVNDADGLACKSPLYYAVRGKALECVRELLEAGATPNTPQVFSETPLHVAATMGSTEIIKLLLKYGASLTVQCGVDKSTALHLAASDGDADCVMALIDGGAKLTATNGKLQTPLHLAVLSQSFDILELLLKRGADPNATDINGRTPLHAAVVKLSGSSESVKPLLNAGANANRSDEFGYTPLHLAALNEFSECVMLLLNYGGDMTAKTKGGVSVLTFITRRTPDVICKFISKLDSSIKLNDREIGDVDCELKMEFRILVPPTAKGETDLLLNFIEVGRKDVLQHPICETFLFLKWRRIRKFFLMSLFYRAVFACLYSFYILGVYLRHCPENPEQNADTKRSEKLCVVPTHLKILEYGLISLNLILLVKEMFQVAHSWVIYVKEKENWVKWLNIITVYCSIFQYGGCDVAGIGLFLTWLELMLTVGRFPTFGLYVQMFKTVSVNFSKLLMAYIFLIIGFALSFGVLFVNYKSFKTLLLVFYKTFIMMSGELEFEDFFYDETAPIIYPITAHAMTLLFVLLVTIILTNLLVGLAVNDIQGLRKSAGLDRLVRQTELVSHLEGVLFSRLLRWLPKRLLIFIYRRALLLKSHYRWALYIKPNDPRERQIPKYIIKKIYNLVSERKRNRNSRK